MKINTNDEAKTGYAYVSVITDYSYFVGLKVLYRSLLKTGTKIPFYVLIPTDADEKLKKKVSALGAKIIELDFLKIDKSDSENNLMKHWNDTFFKLNILKLTQFKKIIYLDSDMLIQKNIDSLFSYPSISATTGGKSEHPEWIEFNSGIMVISPDETVFDSLIAVVPAAIERKRKAGLGYGDQDVFNEYYHNWKNLEGHDFGELYNAEVVFLKGLMLKHSLKTLSEIYVLHYIGARKIWNNSLIQNLRLIYGCIREKRYYELKAYIIYWKNMLLTQLESLL